MMLGTNDCKTVFGADALRIERGIGLCLRKMTRAVPERRILLISPPLLGEDVWREDKDPAFDRRSVKLCAQLPEVYKKIAALHGFGFLAASDCAIVSSADDEHLTVRGHRLLADAVYNKLIDMEVI